MKILKINALKLFPALIFSTLSAYCATAHAIPKAAEDEHSPVTTGADVARPVPSKKATQTTTAEKGKKTVNKKQGKSAKSSTASKGTKASAAKSGHKKK